MAAAVREAEEETGLTVRHLKKISTESFPGYDLTLFHSSDFDGNVNITWENSEYHWVRPADALKMDLVPGIAKAISGFV